LRTIDDVGPLDEFCDRFRMESELVFGDCRQKLCAGFEVRIVKLLVALVVQEVFVVFWSKKCALMMVKPPGNFRRWRVLEVNDCILVADEIVLIEERTGAMYQTKVGETGVIANAFRIKARE
jgi:hypothetical protein